MNRTVASTLAYAIRMQRDGTPSHLVSHGREIIRSIESDYLPHGSGVDIGVTVDVDRSTSEAIVFLIPYHVMDGTGSYAGWCAFEVTARPSFALGLDVEIEAVDRTIFETCECASEDFSTCDCQSECDHVSDDDEHGEGCIIGNDDGLADMLAEGMVHCLSRVLTAEEYVELSDLRAHMADAA